MNLWNFYYWLERGLEIRSVSWLPCSAPFIRNSIVFKPWLCNKYEFTSLIVVQNMYKRCIVKCVARRMNLKLHKRFPFVLIYLLIDYFQFTSYRQYSSHMAAEMFISYVQYVLFIQSKVLYCMKWYKQRLPEYFLSFLSASFYLIRHVI